MEKKVHYLLTIRYLIILLAWIAVYIFHCRFICLFIPVTVKRGGSAQTGVNGGDELKPRETRGHVFSLGLSLGSQSDRGCPKLPRLQVKLNAALTDPPVMEIRL